MIASLRGTLLYSDTAFAVVECGGVGFKCYVTRNTLNKLPQTGKEVFLHTYMVVREDAMDLYGFIDSEELSAFKLITSVNGVGAKIGLSLLSDLSASKIMLSIASNDAKALTAASGVGIKLAQRIVLELKEKVGSLDLDSSEDIAAVQNTASNSASSEAVEALVALGYSKGEASLTVARLDASLPTDELIKQALKALARRL